MTAYSPNTQSWSHSLSAFPSLIHPLPPPLSSSLTYYFLIPYWMPSTEFMPRRTEIFDYSLRFQRLPLKQLCMQSLNATMEKQDKEFHGNKWEVLSSSNLLLFCFVLNVGLRHHYGMPSHLSQKTCTCYSWTPRGQPWNPINYILQMFLQSTFSTTPVYVLSTAQANLRNFLPVLRLWFLLFMESFKMILVKHF